MKIQQHEVALKDSKFLPLWQAYFHCVNYYLKINNCKRFKI